MSKTLLVAILTTTLFVTAACARAGTFDVTACGDTTGNVNNSWVPFNTNSAFLETVPGAGNVCSYPGLGADDVLGLATNVPEGTEAGWTITAPTGTAITAAGLNRDLYKLFDDHWLVFTRDSAGDPLDPGCTINLAQSGFCQESGRINFSNLSTLSLSVGVHCSHNANAACANGGTAHYVHAILTAATVTITETTNPTLTSATGPLLASGWQSATQLATVNASDITGIRYLRVYVDGALASTSTQPCDFTFTVPCPQAPNGSVALDTSHFANGQHQLQVAAVNAAGNETRGAVQTVSFDNTPPPPPGAIRLLGRLWASTPRTIVWTNPPQVNLAPIVAVLWQACNTNSGVCSAVQTQAGNLTSLNFDPATLPPFSSSPDGPYTVSVWLGDAAGNARQANAAAVVVGHSAAPPPPVIGLRVIPSISSRRRTTATWRPPPADGRAPYVGVRWSFCKGRRCFTGSHGAPLHLRAASLGTWTFSIRNVDAAGHASVPAAAGFGYKLDPHLRVVHVTRSGGRIVVAGTIAVGGRVSVKVSYERFIHGHESTVSTTAMARDGRFDATLQLPRALAGVAGGRIVVRFAGSAIERPAIVVEALRSPHG